MLRGFPLSARRIALPLALAFLSAALYGASGLLETGGEWTAPLDDSYIYYQYARTLAGGHALAYEAGDPPTTGATSLLHVVLLAPWFLVGVRGSGIVAASFLGGALAFAATLWFLRDLLEARCDRGTALWGVLLCAASGPLAWGFFSGMELPLFHLLFVASCHSLLTPASPRRRTLLLSGLALARPEGLLFPLALLVARVALPLFGGRGSEPPEGAQGGGAPAPAPALPAARALAIPILVGLVPFLIALLSTGTLATQSLRAKALLYEGSTTPGELIARGSSFFAAVTKGMLGGGTAEPAGALSANRWQVGAFFPPLFLGLFLIGVLPEAAEEAWRRRPAFFLPAVVWFFGGLLLESFLLPYPSHWNRYEMPFFSFFLIGAVLGARRAAVWLGEARGGRALFHGGLAFALAYSAVGWATLAVGFGRNARDIHDQHVAGGRWIAANLPPAARVAVNDAGALAYFGKRPILDLLGLVSRGPTEPTNEGTGALYEYLESLAPGARPTHFAVYPDWFQLGDTGLFGATLHTVPLFRPSIAGSPLPLTICAADWSLAGSGDSPAAVPPGWRAVDALDVADLASEAGHGYRFRRPGPGLPESEARALTYAGEGAPRVADGGRLLAGGERFRVTVRERDDVYLVARTDGPFALDVSVDGRPLGPWTHMGEAGHWSEAAIRIPADRVVSSRLEIGLDPPPDFGQRGYRVFHYWVCQRG